MLWEAFAAGLLSAPSYMDACTCGTPIEKFITGKQAYMDERAPGLVSYNAMMDTAWRPTIAGTQQNPVTKPGYVTDNTAPTSTFLIDEITHHEDVELFIHYEDGRVGDHYVTLYMITPPEGGVGEIGFIDP
jgi:hypothetical protein